MPIKFLHKKFGITKKEIPVIIFVLFGVLIFGIHFLRPINYEFLIYITIILLFIIAILCTNKKVKYPTSLLRFLSIGGLLHLAGGAILVNGEVLYNFIPFLISEKYPIIRYDQIVHTFGFFTATILAYSIIRQRIGKKKIGLGLSIILITSGMGFGALNEIMEFLVSQNIENNLVGGYINTSLDLISNLIGSTIAVIYIKLFLEKKDKFLF